LSSEGFVVNSEGFVVVSATGAGLFSFFFGFFWCFVFFGGL